MPLTGKHPLIRDRPRLQAEPDGERGSFIGMARTSTKPKASGHLSPADLAVLERLVEVGALVAKPQNGSAKPRQVMAAALARGGKQIILWLSKNTMELDGG